jgi:hypothetical protein
MCQIPKSEKKNEALLFSKYFWISGFQSTFFFHLCSLGSDSFCPFSRFEIIAGCQWLTPAILATWEAEIRRSTK